MSHSHSHHRTWKRRRPHRLPVMHRTLHRYSWERAMRHEAAGQGLDKLKHGLEILLGGFFLLLALSAGLGLLSYLYQAAKLILAG